MKFSEIIGQKICVDKLRNHVREGRISHAQLFAGQEGSGNLALALAYATYINCTNRTVDDSCGTCPSCHKFSRLIHPDMHFVFPVAPKKNADKTVSDDYVNVFREMVIEQPYSGFQEWIQAMDIDNKQATINTEQGNEIIRKLSLRSFESKYKTMLIWFPEKMNHYAANKLLKILEEPPDNTLFLLVSEKPDELLPTILSRTQKIDIPPTEEKEIALTLVAKGLCGEEQALNIARLCEGNFNLALQLIHSNEQENLLQNEFRSWMFFCSQTSALQKAISWSENFSQENRETIKNLIQYGVRVVRQLLLQHLGISPLIRETPEEEKFNRDFMKHVHAGNCEQILQVLSTCAYEIERNGNAKIVLTDTSMRIARLLAEPPKAVA